MVDFKDPSARYRGLPFWSWNCRITKELIDEQLPVFKEMGFGGVVIHPREGLDTVYLGDEFMRLVKHTSEKCCELGLICWIYDDDRFPSGAADGLVTKDPRNRARQLRLTRTRLDDGYCRTREEFEAAIDSGEIPRGYFLAAYDIQLNNKRLSGYKRLTDDDGIRSAENVYYAYLELQEESAWFQGQTYVDTMSPAAVDEFIRVTHERYKDSLGSELGGTAEAIFTDEPRLGKQVNLKSAEGGEDAFMPYNEYFSDRFYEKYGFDPLDIVPEYVWDNADGTAHNRLIYRDMAAECFASAFMDRICAWCRENGILSTGHILGEETLSSQTSTVGDAMRAYRNMDIPGIDILIDGRELNTAKQAASVAAQNGTTDVMSEEYGVTNWDADFKTFKLQGDWQAALGITKRVPHLSHMSLEGEAKRDWPGSIFYHAPWYKEFKSVEDYFARLNSSLTRGKRQTRVAVIHPVESMWLSFSPDDVSGSERDRLNKEFEDIASWLLYGTMDFDYISESLLPKQNADYSGAHMSIGNAAYEAVVVPDLLTIRSTTLDALERFINAGGTVIFAGGIPGLVDGLHSDRAAQLAAKCDVIPFERGSLLSALERQRDISIVKADGKPSDNLFYQLRRDGKIKWLFVTHVNETGQQRENYTIAVNGRYYVTLCDAMTGNKYKLPADYKDGRTYIKWTCFGEDSILLMLSDTAQELPEYKSLAEPEAAAVIKKADGYKLHEPNVLLLDYASFSVDGGEIQHKEEILRAENKIRKQLGFFERTGMDKQPYATDSGEAHDITLYYEFFSDISAPVRLAVENPHLRKFILNGEEASNASAGCFVDNSIKIIDLPDIKPGKNELVIKMRYDQKSFIENIYLLGDFAVNADRVITEPKEALSLDDITKQGLPYYTGSIDYSFDAVLDEDGEYFVRIPDFSAPVMAVYVDGKRTGTIAYSPHRAALGTLSKGRHTITITLYGNRFNSFGMLHNANENYTWYGNSSYRTSGKDWTDGYMLRPVGIMSDVIIERII